LGCLAVSVADEFGFAAEGTEVDEGEDTADAQRARVAAVYRDHEVSGAKTRGPRDRLGFY